MLKASMPIIDDKISLIQQMPKGSKILALDLGDKTIGLAISDTDFTIASALETIKRKKFGADATALEEIIKQETIGAMVMGWPLNMDGSEGPRAQSTRAFIRNFENRGTKLPIILWDERLSTMAVTRTLLEADTSRAKRAELVDKMAAAYILQGFLDFLQEQK
ncbi:MAG: Holliday junction resolvase RuvX [Parvibaculales bacterium]